MMGKGRAAASGALSRVDRDTGRFPAYGPEDVGIFDDRKVDVEPNLAKRDALP